MIHYLSAADMLTALSFQCDDTEVLFGLTTDLSLEAPGIHSIHPYHVGSSYFSTFSTVSPGPGSLSYSGILLGDSSVVQAQIFDRFGDMDDSVNLKIIHPTGPSNLLNIDLYDFRIRAIALATRIVGNTTMVTGSVSVTFRNFATAGA
jgi:hypothetical protein